MTTPKEEILANTRKIAIPEESVLKKLLRDSAEFKNFYDAERYRLHSNIFWVWNESLEPYNRLLEGELARANWVDNNNVVIIFLNNPLEHYEASIIAHEIAHIIVKERGFPLAKIDESVRGCEGLELQIYTLNTALHDLLVINLLISYDFDLTTEYTNECEKFMQQIGDSRRDVNPIQKIILVLNYVLGHFINQILFADYDHICNQSHRRIEELYPDISEQSIGIIELINTKGIDTPDKMKTVLEIIIKDFLGMDLFISV